jgi:hypothetical protein
MTTQTVENVSIATVQSLLRNISALPVESLQRVAAYVEELIEELEDAEDIAYIEAHKDEPTVPFSEVIKDYEAKYGPFTRA